MYPIFTVFVIFAIFTFIYMNRSTSSLSKEKENFLEKEREANSVRKQPITDLNYIKINLNELPEINTDDEYIKERLNTLNVLSGEDTKIVNLSAYTNTDLKLKYGVANLTILTEYDQNFTSLCRCLYEIGRRLYDAGNIEDARVFLEYGIKCGTDLKLHYTLLADIYEQNMQYKEIVALIKNAENVNSVLKPSLIRELTKRLEGTGYTVSEEEAPLEDITT
ncbi:MAG: hypothetical protein Q4D29_09430 [Lachnospiraceae bacterium]|nr:hypothetical protein [Lachnospiraceae bacterium]